LTPAVLWSRKEPCVKAYRWNFTLKKNLFVFEIALKVVEWMPFKKVLVCDIIQSVTKNLISLNCVDQQKEDEFWQCFNIMKDFNRILLN
jgi:hypothetical protein